MKRENRTGKDDSQTLTFIAVELDGNFGIIETCYITGVKRCPRIVPVPYAPPFLLGVVKLDGGILPVVSISCFFDREPGPLTPESRILMLSQHLNGGECRGLFVDRVLRVVNIPASKIRLLSRSERKGPCIFVRGIVSSKDFATLEGIPAPGTAIRTLRWIDLNAIFNGMKGAGQPGISCTHLLCRTDSRTEEP